MARLPATFPRPMLRLFPLLAGTMLVACIPIEWVGDGGTTDSGEDGGHVMPSADAGVDAGSEDAGPPDASLAPTLSAIQDGIFSVKCSTGACHNPAWESLSGNLDLSPGQAYYNLVGDAGLGIPVDQPWAMPPALPGVNMLLVDPGHPESSFIIIKVATLFMDPNDGDGGYGYPMPYTTTPMPISEAQLQQIEAWISAGAPND